MTDALQAVVNASCWNNTGVSPNSIDTETPSALPTGSVEELLDYIAVLQALNHTLYADAQTAAEHAQFQLAEAEHRFKNIFSTIQALITQTAYPGDTGKTFRAAFGARLLALARSHELLGAGYADGAPLNLLIERCPQPFESRPDRFTVCGPGVYLRARDVLPVGLALHELTINAVKYGALSIPGGRVEVTWQVEARRLDQARSVAIVWRERGGPPVQPPSRCGFGSRLLQRGLCRVSGGTAQLDFPAYGVDCRIWLPLAAYTAAVTT